LLAITSLAFAKDRETRLPFLTRSAARLSIDRSLCFEEIVAPGSDVSLLTGKKTKKEEKKKKTDVEKASFIRFSRERE